METQTNLDEAVELHVKFKIRLRTFITEPADAVPDFILQDALCPLGKWLYGQSDATITARDEYGHLVHCHKLIHQVGTKAAKQAVRGNKEGAKAMLEPGGEFDAASKNLVLAVVRLKQAVKA